MVIVTWNVLHRIHAVNWDEGVLAQHQDEHARIAAIAEWIGRCDADVVCLQEVSGDQLAAVRDVGTVFATRYPRVPTYYRRTEPTTLGDPAEYLVTITRGRESRYVRGEAFVSDAGKGFQIVEVGGMLVIDAHVSFGDRNAAQCAAILEAVGEAPGVICGDFNADRDVCARHLAGFVAAIPREPALPTRPRLVPSEKSETIDHAFVRGARVTEAVVLDGGGLSDHNPVHVVLDS